MLLTETLFNAYLECETKFYLKSRGKVGADIDFTSWQQKFLKKYKEEGLRELCHVSHQNKCFVGTPSIHELGKNVYRLIIDCVLQGDGIKSHIHALEKMRSCSSKSVILVSVWPVIVTQKACFVCVEGIPKTKETLSVTQFV